MRWVLPLLLLAAPLPASAQEWVARQTATIQALDKVNARVTVLTARVNEPAGCSPRTRP